MVPHLVFPPAAQAAMARGDVLAAGIAILEGWEPIGVQALWTLDKRPIPALARGMADRRGATADPRVLAEMALCWPHCDLALVLGNRLAVVDIDRGDATAHLTRWGIPHDTWREQTQRGEHAFVQVPAPARRRKLKHGDAVVGDLLTGSAYAVVAPSGARTPIDVGRPILPLPPDSALWATVRGPARTVPTLSTRVVTAEDERDAAEVLRRLLVGQYANDVCAILTDGQGRFPSRSEADFALALAASHHLREHPRRAEVMAALLVQHSRKARDHADPGDYVARTVASAVAGRAQRDADRLDSIRTRLHNGLHDHAVQGPNDTNVIGGTFPRGNVGDAVLRWLTTAAAGDEYDRGEGWTRLPVQDAAEVLGVDRRTVSRAVAALVGAGNIDREIRVQKHDGKPRTDTLIRLRSPPA